VGVLSRSEDTTGFSWWLQTAIDNLGDLSYNGSNIPVLAVLAGICVSQSPIGEVIWHCTVREQCAEITWTVSEVEVPFLIEKRAPLLFASIKLFRCLQQPMERIGFGDVHNRVY